MRPELKKKNPGTETGASWAVGGWSGLGVLCLPARKMAPERWGGRGPPIAAVEVLAMLARLVRFVQLEPEAGRRRA
jgi:hypothetical protein